MFAAPFSIRCAVSYSFFPMYSIQGSLFNVCRAVRYLPRLSPFASSFAAPFAIRRAVRHSPRRSPFASSFAAPFAIRRAVSYSFSTIFAIQTSLFNVRRAVSHSEFAIRQSPSNSPFAAPFAITFQCPLTLSIDYSDIISMQRVIIWRLRKRIRATPCFIYFLFVDFNLGKIVFQLEKNRR